MTDIRARLTQIDNIIPEYGKAVDTAVSKQNKKTTDFFMDQIYGIHTGFAQGVEEYQQNRNLEATYAVIDQRRKHRNQKSTECDRFCHEIHQIKSIDIASCKAEIEHLKKE